MHLFTCLTIFRIANMCMIVHNRHDQITWMTHSQSNEYLRETELWQKLYNEAKFVGVVVGDGEAKLKSKKTVTSLSFILYFHNSISVSDSQF